MARALIVAGGCRGRWLAGVLRERGHSARVTTRARARVDEIEAVGAEAVLADPDVIGSLRGALEHVTLVAWLLGTARGSPAAVSALHAERLEMMLRTTIDTTVRGFLYEAAGRVPAEVLAAGARRVREAGAVTGLPWAIVDADPGDRAAWRSGALAAVAGLLGEGRPALPGSYAPPKSQKS
ncbi:MAG: hypothetical protein E6G56_05790 [Actinobacteria bacterium]|nr:MAG: hypothetical protein E6G56_05790 [Actinomycetota bacterium]